MYNDIENMLKELGITDRDTVNTVKDAIREEESERWNY